MDYREAGVDISAADAAKARIKALARGTFNAGVLSEIGSFGGHVPARPRRATASRCSSPPPTAWAPRSRWRSAAGVHDTVGYDLVAHCVNDILVQGATAALLPRLHRARDAWTWTAWRRSCAGCRARLRGVRLPAASAARRRRCPARYAPGDYDLAGFIVGVVERAQRADRRRVRGGRRAARPALRRPAHQRLHAGAQGAVRARWAIDVRHAPAGARHHAWARRCWRPHRGYLAALEPLLERGKIARARPHHGRRLPRQHPARAARRPGRAHPAGRLGGAAAVPAHPARRRRAATTEMYRTFNMGIGMVVVVAPGRPARGGALAGAPRRDRAS